MKTSKGFTLIEMMIVFAILSILLAVGVPSLMDSVERTKIRTSADLINQQINYARSEALRINAKVYVFATTDNTKLCVAINTTTTDTCVTMPDGIKVTSPTPAFYFSGLGIPSVPATFEVNFVDPDKTITRAGKSVSVNQIGIVTIAPTVV